MVRLAGLEPVTPTMSRWCSNQLSYSRIIGLYSIEKAEMMQLFFALSGYLYIIFCKFIDRQSPHKFLIQDHVHQPL